MEKSSNRSCRVSVVIPVYNVEGYISPCLESILRQTVTDIEVICVDDGSTDRSAELCRGFAEKDSRVRVISRQNGGLSKARNLGLREACGEWICFVDADDWLADDMLGQLLKAAAVAPTADIVICNHYRMYESGKRRCSPAYPGDQLWDRGRIEIEQRKLLCKGIKAYRPYAYLGAVWARIYRRSMLSEHGIAFVESLRIAEDGIFNMYAYENSRSIAYVCSPLYFYRILDNSNSRRPYPDVVRLTELESKEVRSFAERYKTDDALFRKGTDARLCTRFSVYLDRLYFQPSYLKEKGYREVRRELLTLLEQPLYRDAYARVDMSILNAEQRVFVRLEKWKWIDALYAMVWIKKTLKALYRR